MKSLGYSTAEQKLVLSRLMVLNYAPDCPYTASASSFVSIESAADDHNQLQTAFKEFLQMTKPDFGLCRLPSREGNVFMCAKIDKSGIEGNPLRCQRRREYHRGNGIWHLGSAGWGIRCDCFCKRYFGQRSFC